MAKRMGSREWALLGLLATLWGMSFLFAKVAGCDLSPLALALARVGFAALMLWGVAAALGQVGRDLPWPALLVMGLLNNALPFGLIFWAQTAVTSALASVLNACTPFATVVVAHLLTRDEKISGAKLAGLALGLTGLVAMIGPGVLAQAGGDPIHEMAVIGATIAYACAGVFGRRLATLPPLLAAAGQLTGATAILLPVVLLTDPGVFAARPGAETIGAVIGLAGLSTACAYVLYFRILATAGATNLLLVTFLIPPVAIGLGFVVLGERLAAHQLGGLLGIALGLAVIDGRLTQRVRRLASR